MIGVHVNALASAATPIDPSDLAGLSDEDRQRAADNQRWWYGHSGYATQMSTRPQTLAYALNDSPAGQLAWNLEWFVDWDPTSTQRTPVDRDTILTDVTVFWLTGIAGSAARFYFEATPETWGRRPARSAVPTAVANFLGDRAVRGWRAFRVGAGAGAVGPRRARVLPRELTPFGGGEPSAQVIDAIGRELLLESDARGHLYRLAGLSPGLAEGVGGLTRAFEVFVHPVVGRVELTYQTFDVTDAPGQQLLVGTPAPGSDSAAGVAMLADADRKAANVEGHSA